MSDRESLLVESAGLAGRICEVRDLMGGSVPRDEYAILLRQYESMQEYAKCLRFRLSLLPEIESESESELPVVLDDSVSLSSAGLDSRTLRYLDRAGFRTVGEVRKAYVSALADGGDLTDLPGIGEATAPEVETKLLNDRSGEGYAEAAKAL